MNLSNCPVCLVGVVEPFGYIELKEGPLEFKLGRFQLAKKMAITIWMCNREQCQHVGTGATREYPTLAKSLLRELILSLEKRTNKS
ncbi:hypothetical protein [Paenibacillus periandrae]|uniref:hypothetical protein n=1 Tax=Paenibacillus periandrae TaxID=1761741 RepID=UPI001F09FB21|nr:hypothetical protein [Paenibacillus periandrae]